KERLSWSKEPISRRGHYSDRSNPDVHWTEPYPNRKKLSKGVLLRTHYKNLLRLFVLPSIPSIVKSTLSYGSTPASPSPPSSSGSSASRTFACRQGRSAEGRRSCRTGR